MLVLRTLVRLTLTRLAQVLLTLVRLALTRQTLIQLAIRLTRLTQARLTLVRLTLDPLLAVDFGGFTVTRIAFSAVTAYTDIH